MTAATAERTWSTPEIAADLGVTPNTIWRWAWKQTGRRPGSGGRLRLDAATTATMYAWAALGVTTAGHDPRTCPVSGLHQAIAAALRARVAPYIVATPDHAVAVDTTLEAAEALTADWARPAATFINITGAPPWSA